MLGVLTTKGVLGRMVVVIGTLDAVVVKEARDFPEKSKWNNMKMVNNTIYQYIYDFLGVLKLIIQNYCNFNFILPPPPLLFDTTLIIH